jgi:hypothetical protein
MRELLRRAVPGTTLGWWSVGLVVVTPILLAIGASFRGLLYEGVAAGDSIPEDITSRPALALTMLTGMAAGVAGFVTGLVAIVRRRDYAWLVLASTVLGGLFTLFLAAEVAFSH